MEIVPFAACHQPAVAALWGEAFGYTEARNVPARSIARKEAWADGLFWVATDADDVLGTVMAGYDGHRGWIYSLAVRPDLRRRGIGSALLARAEAELTALGCMKINLQLLASNSETAAFYHAHGYRIEPRISMGKAIHENATTIPCPGNPTAAAGDIAAKSE